MLTILFAAVFVLEISLVLLLALMPRLGQVGKDFVEACTKAPWLDLLLSIMTWIPWAIGGLLAGWLGIAIALVAQIGAMQLWIFSHGLAHRDTVGGSRIVKFHNRTIGWWRNSLALWVTTLVLPVFWLIRFAQCIFYPLLSFLVGFPTYKHDEWINVSRQKFQGLVGHDLIWCLYCDWMTGVYALGAEMLRNVESFWCPIRFYDGKKCENCKLDFPDVEGGWIGAQGNMEEVDRLLNRVYGDRQKSWFGHPERH